MIQSYKQYNDKKLITESAGIGVAFEWAIVYEALKGAGMTDDELVKRNAKLVPGSGKQYTEAKKAIKNVPKELWITAKHYDETSVIGAPVKGKPEPKTDILFGKNNEYRVSVKLSGSIQLASGEGISSSKMLESVMNEYASETNVLPDEAMKQIIAKISGMPTKMISPQNIERVKKENPELFKKMLLPDGELNPAYNWKEWEKENKEQIKTFLQQYVANHPKFAFILVEEALTGKRTFGPNNLATANYIITPAKFVKIDDSYVENVSKKTKIDIRAKSRKGVTSAAMRFDYKTEEVATFLDESIWKRIKTFVTNLKNRLVSGIKNLFSAEDIQGKIDL